MGAGYRFFTAFTGICVFFFQPSGCYGNTTTFSIMLKQMRHILVGFLIIYIAHIIPLGFYRKMAYVAYVVGLGLLVYTLFGGDTLNRVPAGCP